MPNYYFQFKQFTIFQGHSAMKVCTDACLFGAWVQPGKARYILDIGTGTGLLALMLATKTSAEIDAVEMDEGAIVDAAHNFWISDYRDQINLFETSIQDFEVEAGFKYDLIISNPPFFERYMKRKDLASNRALHQQSLSLPELLNAVTRLIKKEGRFLIMLPPYEAGLFHNLANEAGLFLQETMLVSRKEGQKAFRVFNSFSYSGTNGNKPVPQVLEMAITEAGSNEYTAEFRRMLKGYYLNL